MMVPLAPEQRTPELAAIGLGLREANAFAQARDALVNDARFEHLGPDVEGAVRHLVGECYVDKRTDHV